MPKVDLHVHTTASDGRHSPTEIVRRAAKLGLSLLAITDHDTVGGLAEALDAAREFPELELVPGVEINTDVATGEAHVLGYFIDYTHPELLSVLRDMRVSRQERAQKMIAKLGELGMPLDWERVKALAGTDSIGRPHIAQALLEKGYISNLREAFDRYISREGPAYVERTKVTPLDATKLILRAKGLPVLGHPLTIGDPEAMIRDLAAGGLVGIEAYYGGYKATEVARLVRFADSLQLLTTGGSDYHGLDENSETKIGEVHVPASAVQRLLELADERSLRQRRDTK